VIDPRVVGRRYGPYRFVVGQEAIRDFATVVAGGQPGRVFAARDPATPHPWYVDEAAARASRHGGIVAPPSFCARFAMEPFAAAILDPDLGIDLPKLLHGEQELEWGDVIRPDDVMETWGQIADVRQKAGLDFLTVKTTTTNQRGRSVVVGTWKAVIRP
jgi:acyl dehydratase